MIVYQPGCTDWSMTVRQFLLSPASDISGLRTPGHCSCQGRRRHWGWGVLRSPTHTSKTVCQLPFTPQCSRLCRLLDISRPTCSTGTDSASEDYLGHALQICTLSSSSSTEWPYPSFYTFQFLPREAMLSAVFAVVVCLCVCLSVWVSVTLRYCIKTAIRRITQTTPHDSPMILVFWCQRSWQNSNGITPYGGDKCRWGGLKFTFCVQVDRFDLSPYVLQSWLYNI